MTLAQEMLDARSAREKLAKTELPVPGYFSARGLLHDSEWVDSYLSIVLQWPKSCTIAVEDKQLIGLAKSLAFMWEPGILNHTDLALETGITPEQITECVKVVSSVVGLANLDKTARSIGTAVHLDARRRRALACVQEYFGVIPGVFRRTIVVEDLDWLNDLLIVTRPAFDSAPEIINPRIRAYVALAAASIVGWEEGILLYSKVAQCFGSKKGEIHDVIKSVFKTSVSNSMAAGFRSPCHIPKLEKYATILSSYVEKGALSKRKADVLSNASR